MTSIIFIIVVLEVLSTTLMGLPIEHLNHLWVSHQYNPESRVHRVEELTLRMKSVSETGRMEKM